jgi:ureidoglycolate lyase
MRELAYRLLTPEAFAPYGSYGPMIDPDAGGRTTPRLGQPPVEFFRDLVQSGIAGDTTVSFGTCRVTRRPPVIDASEYHDTSCEALLPLDGDVLIHVAPAVPGDRFPADQAEVFLVPRGTMVVIRPGVWHHGPFALAPAQTVSCLVALPERLYARDCHEGPIAEADRIRIVGPRLDS